MMFCKTTKKKVLFKFFVFYFDFGLSFRIKNQNQFNDLKRLSVHKRAKNTVIPDFISNKILFDLKLLFIRVVFVS
jgi:hypothetical protein